MDRDLNKLINQIKKFKTLSSKNDDDSEDKMGCIGSLIDNDLQEIDKKIVVLEKIIAESVTESELLKKYYFCKRNSQKSAARRS